MSLQRFIQLILILIVLIISIGLIEHGNSFFVFVGNQTACNTCDDYETYSKRNVMCCFGFSKCCGPTSFEEEDMLKLEQLQRANATSSTPRP